MICRVVEIKRSGDERKVRTRTETTRDAQQRRDLMVRAFRTMQTAHLRPANIDDAIVLHCSRLDQLCDRCLVELGDKIKRVIIDTVTVGSIDGQWAASLAYIAWNNEMSRRSLTGYSVSDCQKHGGAAA